MLRTLGTRRVIEVELLQCATSLGDVSVHLSCPLAGVAVGTVEYLREEFARDFLDLDAIDLLFDREVDVGAPRRHFVRQPKRLRWIRRGILHFSVVSTDHRAKIERDVQEGPDMVPEEELVF